MKSKYDYTFVAINIEDPKKTFVTRFKSQLVQQLEVAKNTFSKHEFPYHLKGHLIIESKDYKSNKKGNPNLGK